MRFRRTEVDHVFATAGVLMIAAGIIFGLGEGLSAAWGWFAAAVPYFILALRG